MLRVLIGLLRIKSRVYNTQIKKNRVRFVYIIFLVLFSLNRRPRPFAYKNKTVLFIRISSADHNRVSRIIHFIIYKQTGMSLFLPIPPRYVSKTFCFLVFSTVKDAENKRTVTSTQIARSIN